jgi:tetratricopeptide (TPR) repeat protein
MLSDAIIAGSLGQALFRDGERVWLLASEDGEPRTADPNDISAFHNIAREVVPADPAGLPISTEALRDRLREEVGFFQGLDGLLVGMDEEFSEDSRRKAIRSAERILASDEILAKRIRARFLIPTNDQEWDPKGALRLAQLIKADAAAAAYAPLVDGTVNRIVDDLTELTRVHFGVGVEAQSRREGLVRSGLVAALCGAMGDRAKLLSLPFQRGSIPHLEKLDPNGKILTALVGHLASSATGAEPTRSPLASDGRDFSENESDPIAIAVLAAMESQSSRKGKGQLEYDLGAIQREINWIGDRLRAGELARAETGLIYLIGNQAQSSRAGDIVKSLTAVASQGLRFRQFEFATRLLRAADLFESQDAALMCVRGELLRDIGQPDEALIVFREAMERFPHGEVPPNAYAETLRYLGRPEEALEVFRDTMERFPHDEVAPTAYAGTLRDLSRPEEALEVFRDAMERFPHDEVAPAAFAETLRDLGRPEEALEVFRDTMERFPHNEVAPNAYAETLRYLGRPEEALEVFRDAMERFPRNEVAPTAFAETLRDLGRPEEALEVFRDTMGRFPHNEVAPNAYAETLRDLGRPEEALDAFREAMERFPHNEVARNACANLLMVIGQKQEAEELLLPAVKRLQSRNDWIALHILAMGDLRRRATGSAVKMLRRGSNGCPFRDVNRYFRNALGVALIMDRKAREALVELESIVRESPAPFQKATALLVKAHALGECGDVRSTDTELSKIKEQFTLTPTQRHLSDSILATYVNRSSPLSGRALGAANDNIFALEFELMARVINHGSSALRLAA